MKALILLADGFEESEAIVTHDILTRSGIITPTLGSASDSLTVTTSMGLKVQADELVSMLDLSLFDMLILPGGKVGVDNLGSLPTAIKTIDAFILDKKPVHAICAAPSLLGKRGYLDDKEYACFPGFERGNGTHLDKGAVLSKGTVTGRSMGYTMEFALTIVGLYGGEPAQERVLKGILGR